MTPQVDLCTWNLNNEYGIGGVVNIILCIAYIAM